jgi:hypothetical protein
MREVLPSHPPDPPQGVRGGGEQGPGDRDGALPQRPRALAQHLEDARLLGLLQQEIVARRQSVDQAELAGAGAVPMLARRDRLDLERRSHLADEALEELVGLVDLLLQLGSPLLGDLPEQGHGALEAAGRDVLVVDAVALEQPVQVRHRRDDPDRADDRERGRDDAVGDAGHHVAAARGDLVHADRERNPLRPDAGELRRREAIAVNRPAGALEAHHDLVSVARDPEHDGDLLTQRVDLRRQDISLEVEDEHPLLGQIVALARLAGLALATEQAALAWLQGGLERLRLSLPARADLAQLHVGLRRAARAQPREEHADARDERDEDDESLGYEPDDIEDHFHREDVPLVARPSNAPNLHLAPVCSRARARANRRAPR